MAWHGRFGCTHSRLWSMFIVGHLSKFCHFISHVDVNVSILKMVRASQPFQTVKCWIYTANTHTHTSTNTRKLYTYMQRIQSIQNPIHKSGCKTGQKKIKEKLLKINAIWTTRHSKYLNAECGRE